MATPSLIEQLEVRTLLAQAALTPVVDGQVSDRDVNGTFETIDSTSTTVTDRWFTFATTPSIGREYPIFEFDLSNIAAVGNAKLGFTVGSFTQSTLNGVTSYAKFNIAAYGGQSGIISSDGTASAVSLGSGTVTSAGYQEVSLNATALAGLAGQRIHIRLENTTPDGNWFQIFTQEETFRTPPTLTISDVTIPNLLVPTINVTAQDYTYFGQSLSATATATGAGGVTVPGTMTSTYYTGPTASGSGTTSPPVDAGTYTVVASFVSADPQYVNAQSAPVTFSISQAIPTVVVTNAGGIYNGQAFAATATAKGVNGVTVSGSNVFTYYAGTSASGTGSTTAPVNSGTYTVVAAFTSNDPNYGNAQSTPVTFSIGKATPIVIATNAGGSYTGQPFAATGTAKGVNGVTVSGNLAFTYYVGTSASGTGSSAAPVSLGTYTVVAAFTSNDPNYRNAQSSPVTFTISKFQTKVVASISGGTYTGQPFNATATATGSGGATVTGRMVFLYFFGNFASGDGSSAAPSDVGTYTVVAIFTSGNANYTSTQSAPVTFSIGKAIPTVAVTNPGGTYTGHAFPATALITGVDGTSVNGILAFTYYVGTSVTGTGSAAAPLNPGTYTVVASFTSSSVNYVDTQSPPLTFSIGKLVPTIVATNAGGVYQGQAFNTTATVNGVGGAAVSGTSAFRYYVGSTVSGTGSSTPPVNVGTYTVVATFTSSDAVYGDAQSAPVTFIISKATPTVGVTNLGGNYTGQAFPAAAAAKGIGGASIGGSFTFTYYSGPSVAGTGSSSAPANAGTYTVVASFTSSDSNYANAQSASLTFTIGKATPTVVATIAGGVYQGQPFPVTTTAKGIGGASISGSTAFRYYVGSTISGTGSSTAPVNPGTYTVVATFTSSDSNYNNTQSRPATFTISKAPTTVVAADAGGTFSGQAFPATATAKGIGGVAVTGNTTFTYYVGTSVSGTGSSSAPANAGVYTVVASFTSSDPNYADAQSSPVMFTVGKASPIVVATAAGGPYTGQPLAATATAKGIGGVAVSGNVAFTYYAGTSASGTGSSTAPANQGTYTVVAAFTSSDPNYTNASSNPVTFTIGKTNPIVVVTATGGSYTGQPFAATAIAKRANGVAVSGNVSFTYYAGTSASGTGSPAAPANAGVYTVVASFTSSDPNSANAQSSPVTFTIGKASPTVVAVNSGGTYNGREFPATATAKGIGGTSINGSLTFAYYTGPSVTGTGTSSAPVNAGTYTVVATFTSSDLNYGNQQSAPVTFTIGKANPTVVATSPGGPYNGRPFPASAIAKGVGGVTLRGSMVITYYTGTTATGSGSASAPVNAGTYTVVATFTSNDPNYGNGQSSPVTFKIATVQATQLGFLQPPVSGVAGVAISPAVKVAVLDQSGQVVVGNSSSVTLTLVGGTFSNGFTFTKSPAVDGIATFSNLVINAAGTYTLTVSSGTLTAATSKSFVVAPATASKLLIQQQPTTGTAGQNLSPALRVAVADRFGNIVTSNSSSVTLTLNTGIFTAGGSTVTVQAVNGIATFSNLKISKLGTYTLTARSGTLAASTSSAFSIR